jgi:Fe-S cluster assembly protein SufB
LIFSSISEAMNEYPDLIEKYLGSVPIGDNYFAALNSAVLQMVRLFIFRKTICPLDLSTYFRINDPKSGQFERTLIITEKNSQVNYLEGCTAPQYDTNQLRCRCRTALENATIKYSTVQNWYSEMNLEKEEYIIS